MMAKQQSSVEAARPQPRDFLYYLEKHIDNDFEYSDDRLNTFIGLALEHEFAPYDSQTERTRAIINAALSRTNKFDTPEEYIEEFNRLRLWIPKIQQFSMRVYEDAKKAFVNNPREGDFGFSSTFDEWWKATFDYLRRELFAIIDAIYTVLKSSRKISSRWHDTIINPDNKDRQDSDGAEPK